jgi:hypothetical protein
LFDIPDEFVNCEFKWTFSDILPMVLFVVSSVKIFSLFKQDERNIFFFLSFFSNKQGQNF